MTKPGLKWTIVVLLLSGCATPLSEGPTQGPTSKSANELLPSEFPAGWLTRPEGNETVALVRVSNERFGGNTCFITIYRMADIDEGKVEIHRLINNTMSQILGPNWDRSLVVERQGWGDEAWSGGQGHLWVRKGNVVWVGIASASSRAANENQDGIDWALHCREFVIRHGLKQY